MATIGQDIEQAIRLLQADEVVAIPTETVYGLAGNAFSEKAIRKIFEVKNRPLTDPLIVHTHSVEKVLELTTGLPQLGRVLFETFSPGPLTLLLHKSKLIPDLVTNHSPLVAIRIPNHPLTLDLLRHLDFPLAAPSANPFGSLSPTRPEHVNASLGDRIPYILDGGPCEVGLESTIVHVVNENEIKVLRQGGIPEEELRSLARLVEEEKSATPVVPGSMLSHYAPKKPIVLWTKGLVKEMPHHAGFLGFRELTFEIATENQVILSPGGDLNEAARGLFAGLHRLDELETVEVIVAELFPEHGLGKAMNDRLRRAAAKRTELS